MEALNDKKRKKRKTRRCLDKLRKKTLEHKVNYSDEESGVNYNTDTKLHNNKSNCTKKDYITSNRLTLFNKAVRSETVTRRQVSELEGKNFELQDRQTFMSNLNTKILSENNNSNNAIGLERQNLCTTDDEMEIFSPKFNLGKEAIETPKSIILFTSESEREKEAVNSNLDSPLETSPISSSPATTNTNIEAKIFASILDGIETYAEQNPLFSTTNFEDYSAITKANVARIIAENRKIYDSLNPDVLAFYNRPYVPLQQYPEDDIQCSWSGSSICCDNLLSPNVLEVYNSPYSSTNISIPQNSKDDIGYSWSPYCYCETRGTHRSSPMDRTSSSSMSIEINSTSPVVSGIYDTPEYTFYPHRLN